MAKYKITGEITIKFDMDVEGDSITTKPEAIELGRKTVTEFYNLNVVGGYHDKENCSVNLDANRVKKEL